MNTNQDLSNGQYCYQDHQFNQCQKHYILHENRGSTLIALPRIFC